VHVGDVMVKDGDLFGDGVNITARLQALALPGGVSVSGAAYDHVRKLLPFKFADLGAQQVKNIEERVRVYAVNAAKALMTSDSPKASDERKPLTLPDKPSIAVLPFQNMSGDPERSVSPPPTSSASPTIQIERGQLKNKLEFNGQVRMGRYLPTIAHQKAARSLEPVTSKWMRLSS
jgi:hypothetical protein